MASESERAFLRCLRRLVPPEAIGASDALLLERFVHQRDEVAFELLVRRYGPLVLNVCRRVLRHSQDAEDAFQATFLTLIRKAGSIGKRTSVGSWLYKVAYRIALQARRRNAGQQDRERQAARLPITTPEEPLDADLREALAEEVSRLPEKYRAAVVLCYFLGKTHEEAARRLGCPKGTVAVRLMRARDLLRGRLERRGWTLSAGLMAAALAECEAAAISDVLLQNTLRSALLLAAGRGLAAGGVSLRVIALLEGALKAMWWTQVKLAAGAVLMVATLGAGGWVALQAVGEEPAAKAEQAATQKSAVKPPARNDEKPAKEQTGEPQASRKDLVEAALNYELDRLRKELAKVEDRYFAIHQEKRTRMIGAEEELRFLQRMQALQREHELAQLNELQQAVRAAEKEVRNLEWAFHEMAQDEKSGQPVNPERIKDLQGRINRHKKRLSDGKESLEEQQQLYSDNESERTELLIEKRKRLAGDETVLGRTEQAEQRRREEIQRDIEHIEFRLHTLRGEVPLSKYGDPDGTRRLESKLDRLLQEVDSLRREVRELKGAGGRPGADGLGAREP